MYQSGICREGLSKTVKILATITDIPNVFRRAISVTQTYSVTTTETCSAYRCAKFDIKLS